MATDPQPAGRLATTMTFLAELGEVVDNGDGTYRWVEYMDRTLT